MKKFKEFLNKNIEESIDSDYNGVSVNGDYILSSIEKNPNNDLMKFTISGEKLLTKVKSIEKLKSEYDEDDWIELEKQYKEVMKAVGKDLEKVIRSTEKYINQIISKLEKSTNI